MAFKAVHPDMTEPVRVPEHPWPSHLEHCKEGCKKDGARCKVGEQLEKLPPINPEDQVHLEIGFWPPRESERFTELSDHLRQLRTSTLEKEGYAAAVEEVVREAAGVRYSYVRDGVAFGVRSWSGIEMDGKPITPEFEDVEIDGRTHKKLKPWYIDLLAVNKLLPMIFLKVLAYNSLTERQKKTSASSLASSASPTRTDAGDATPDTTENRSAGSSETTRQAAS